jgi:hypothetical protein
MKMKRKAKKSDPRKTSLEQGSALAVRARALRLWKEPKVFIMLDPTIRAVRSDPVADTVADYTFAMNAIPYFQAMANYYEQYKITSVTAVYKPYVTEVVTFSGEGADTFTLPDLVYSYKPFSESLTYDQIVQRADSNILSTTEKWTTKFRPIPLMRGFDSLLSDAFLDLGPQWISTADGSTPHYGFTVGIQNSSAVGATPSFGGRISFYYEIEFRYPRFLA